MTLIGDGDLIDVDADSGEVRVVQRAVPEPNLTR